MSLKPLHCLLLERSKRRLIIELQRRKPILPGTSVGTVRNCRRSSPRRTTIVSTWTIFHSGSKASMLEADWSARLMIRFSVRGPRLATSTAAALARRIGSAGHKGAPSPVQGVFIPHWSEFCRPDRFLLHSFTRPTCTWPHRIECPISSLA